MSAFLKGLTTRSTRQGTAIVRLHYSADMDRGPQWVAQERKKYSTQGAWEREQEIIHEAGGGERVFADVLGRWDDKIIIDSSEFQPSPHWKLIAGFDHGSFKVYSVQSLTDKAVKFLRELLPERELNESFITIIRDGTDKKFQMEHNREWLKHTRPILEAFAHARYMVEMAVRYGDLPAPPQPMPSGWAGLLYLYDLR